MFARRGAWSSRAAFTPMLTRYVTPTSTLAARSGLLQAEPALPTPAASAYAAGPNRPRYLFRTRPLRAAIAADAEVEGSE
jgi:hypothetical protein